MANSLTAASPTYWSRAAGRKFYKTTFFKAITDFSEESQVSGNGRIIERPYRSNVVAENYTKGTALTAQDLTYTSDQLTLDQQYSLLMYVDDVDKLQTKYDSVKLWSEEAGQRIGVKYDAHILYQPIGSSATLTANSTVDASNLGGTSGQGITLTDANVPVVFGEINEALDSYNLPQEGRFLCVSPLFRNKLWQYIGGKQSMLGDKTGETGNIGQYAGLNLYLSNNNTGIARWTPGDALTPTDAETLTIEGITFTWKTTIGATAGNVLAVTDMPTSIDNLVALINAGGVTTDVGVSNVSLSTANQRTVQNWVAVDGTTYVEIRVKGTPSLTVSGSATADVWNAYHTNQCLVAGIKGAISGAVQTKGEMGIIDTQMASTVSAGKRGTNVMPLLVGGATVFNVGKDELVVVKVRSDS